jgi:hypothetical protein
MSAMMVTQASSSKISTAGSMAAGSAAPRLAVWGLAASVRLSSVAPAGFVASEFMKDSLLMQGLKRP